MSAAKHPMPLSDLKLLEKALDDDESVFEMGHLGNPIPEDWPTRCGVSMHQFQSVLSLLAAEDKNRSKARGRIMDVMKRHGWPDRLYPASPVKIR